MKLILLSAYAVVASASILDKTHMTRCLPAVREYVQGNSETVSWLFEKTDGDMDVLMLYLMRACFNYHARTNQGYDIEKIEKSLRISAPSFSKDQLEQLSEILRNEFDNGPTTHAEEELHEPLTASLFVTQILCVIVGLGLPWNGKVYKSE